MLGENVEPYNDLNAIAYGETKWGSGRGAGDVLFVFVGTGIGAGLILDGRLYIGASHLAGEIGHTKVVLGGRQCGCGQRGCLEAYVSGRHLRARALEAIAAGQKTLALELAGSLEALHAGHLDEAARRGDAYADALWNESATFLGMALANAVTILNPSRLVMGGGTWAGSPELRRRTEAIVLAAVNAPALEGFTLVQSTLGDLAGVIGAATLVGSLSTTAGPR